MDVIIELERIIDMLRNQTHVQSIEFDDRTSGVHIKVDRNLQRPQRKEDTREDKSFL